MQTTTSKFIYLFLACCSTQLSLHSATWTGGGPDNQFSTASNWEGNQLPNVNGSSEEGEARINSSKIVELNSAQKVMSLRVGSGKNSYGELMISPSTDLIATRKNQASRVGAGRESFGKVIQNGGATYFHILQVGLDQGAQGVYDLSGGTVTVNREAKGISLFLGMQGNGSFSISGDASLLTRAGVQLGTPKGGVGTFEVSGTTFDVSLGGHGDLNGAWHQYGGSRLKARVGTQGVRHIEVIDLPENGASSKVVFEEGALLDLGFAGEPVAGRWLLMQWKGSCENKGLQLAQSVDSSIWSFEIVEVDGVGQLQIESKL